MIRPRLVLALVATLPMMAAAAEPNLVAGSRAPSFTSFGPYGSALVLNQPGALALSANLGPWSGGSLAVGSGPLSAGADGRAIRDIPTARTTPALGHEGDVKDRDDEKLPPPLPGTFRQGPIRVPAPVPGAELKTQLVTPHLTPDVEVIKAGRATVGVFGQVGKVEIDRSTIIPTVRAHELGAGLTLQYKFGQ